MQEKTDTQIVGLSRFFHFLRIIYSVNNHDSYIISYDLLVITPSVILLILVSDLPSFSSYGA